MNEIHRKWGQGAEKAVAHALLQSWDGTDGLDLEERKPTFKDLNLQHLNLRFGIVKI